MTKTDEFAEVLDKLEDFIQEGCSATIEDKTHSLGLIERLRQLTAPGMKDEWNKTTDRLPEKPGHKRYEYVDCLIYHKGEIKQRPWNCEHLCWDDEHYDDYYCNPTEPTHWMPLPAPPAKKE